MNDPNEIPETVYLVLSIGAVHFKDSAAIGVCPVFATLEEAQAEAPNHTVLALNEKQSYVASN